MIFLESFCQFIVEPQNTVFVIGSDSNPVFNCSLEDEIGRQQQWYHFPRNGNSALLSADEATSNEDKHEIQGEYNLVILNPDTTDAGEYHCTNVNFGDFKRARADLVVIG